MNEGIATRARHALLVQDFLENSADRVGNKIALVCDGRRLSYGEIELMANKLSHSLSQMGVQRGDRVGIYLNNSIELVVSIFATLKAGAVFVIVNHTTKRDKLHYVLNNCRAVVLIADARLDLVGLADDSELMVQSLKGLILCGQDAHAKLCARTPSQTFDMALAHSSSARPARRNVDRDLACLIYTSGTTGDPKGVMSDHSNVVYAASAIIEYLGNVEDDIIINVLPLSFDYGLYQLLMTFKFGGTLVLEKSFTFPASILKQMEQEKVTGFPGVPTIYAILMPMDLSTFDLSSLRYLSNTAAALPVNHIQEIRKKFPKATLFSMYGLTETKRTLFLPPSELDRRPGSVGIPIPGTEAWIEDESGKRLGPGEVGELVVRGRHVMRGYWEAPEATTKRYRPSAIPGEFYCYTNDLFRLDEEGFFYFVSRKDDIIKSRGEKVAPKEVESILYAIPGVKEAAVIGVPDAILGQAVKAFIVSTDANLTEKQVLAFCRARMEDYMVPKVVEFRPQLPTTSSGKLTKIGLA
jgi:long-chain acyl-CoA synthetase